MVEPGAGKISAVQRAGSGQVPGSACWKVNFPEVRDGSHEFDPHGPLAVLQGAHIDDAALLLFAGKFVHDQNSLALIDSVRQGKRATVSRHREHVRELIEGFQEGVLPKNVDADEQREPFASAGRFDWPGRRVHSIQNLELQLAYAQ